MIVLCLRPHHANQCNAHMHTLNLLNTTAVNKDQLLMFCAQHKHREVCNIVCKVIRNYINRKATNLIDVMLSMTIYSRGLLCTRCIHFHRSVYACINFIQQQRLSKSNIMLVCWVGAAGPIFARVHLIKTPGQNLPKTCLANTSHAFCR